MWGISGLSKAFRATHAKERRVFCPCATSYMLILSNTYGFLSINNKSLTGYRGFATCAVVTTSSWIP